MENYASARNDGCIPDLSPSNNTNKRRGFHADVFVLFPNPTPSIHSLPPSMHLARADLHEVGTLRLNMLARGVDGGVPRTHVTYKTITMMRPTMTTPLMISPRSDLGVVEEDAAGLDDDADEDVDGDAVEEAEDDVDDELDEPDGGDAHASPTKPLSQMHMRSASEHVPLPLHKTSSPLESFPEGHVGTSHADPDQPDRQEHVFDDELHVPRSVPPQGSNVCCVEDHACGHTVLSPETLQS